MQPPQAVHPEAPADFVLDRIQNLNAPQARYELESSLRLLASRHQGDRRRRRARRAAQDLATRTPRTSVVARHMPPVAAGNSDVCMTLLLEPYLYCPGRSILAHPTD